MERIKNRVWKMERLNTFEDWKKKYLPSLVEREKNSEFIDNPTEFGAVLAEKMLQIAKIKLSLKRK